ncbi:unnamed protein product [Boreogadus saida]
MNLRDNHWPRVSGYRQLTTEPKTRGTEIMRCQPSRDSRETGFTRETKPQPADCASRPPPPPPPGHVADQQESSVFVLNEPINQAILERPLGRSHFITRPLQEKHPLLLIFNRWTLRGQNPILMEHDNLSPGKDVSPMNPCGPGN